MGKSDMETFVKERDEAFIEDIKKAKWYIDKLIEMEGEDEKSEQ